MPRMVHMAFVSTTLALAVAIGAAAADTVAAGPQPLTGRTIVIDPGHHPANGLHSGEISRQVDTGTHMKACDTVGAVSAAGYSEAAHNLDVALRLRRLLVRRGARVALTHNGRWPRFGPCITRRARLANRLGADVAISIHADGHTGPGRGFHVIYPSRLPGLTDDIARPSKRLARAVRREYRRATGLPLANYAGRNGLHARGDLGGLNLSDVPKVFIEAGNLRHAADATLLSRQRFRQREARGLADGLTAYLAANPPAQAAPR